MTLAGALAGVNRTQAVLVARAEALLAPLKPRDENSSAAASRIALRLASGALGLRMPARAGEIWIAMESGTKRRRRQI